MEVVWPDWAVIAASEGKTVVTRITTDFEGRITTAEFEVEDKEPKQDRVTDADDAVVLDVLDIYLGDRNLTKTALHVLRSMPDKGPLARALGITPGDLGLERVTPEPGDHATLWADFLHPPRFEP